MGDPIIIWPPEAWYASCHEMGPYYDCTYDYPDVQAYGGMACCPNW